MKKQPERKVQKEKDQSLLKEKNPDPQEEDLDPRDTEAKGVGIDPRLGAEEGTDVIEVEVDLLKDQDQVDHLEDQDRIDLPEDQDLEVIDIVQRGNLV